MKYFFRLVFVCVLVLLIMPSIARSAEVNCEDVLIHAAHNKLKIERKSSSKSSFESWFFSEDFERLVKKNKSGAGITVPLEGIPITFGGSSQSASAWEKRSSQQNRSKWDFSSDSATNIFVDIVEKDALDIWMACVHLVERRGGPQLIDASATGHRDEIILKFRLLPIGDIHQAEFKNLVCSNSIKWDTKGDRELARALGTRGITANSHTQRLKWASSDAEKGLIVVNTSVGSSKSLIVTRPPHITNAVLTYDMPRNVVEKTRLIRNVQTTDDMHNKKAKKGYPTSNDGRWRASIRNFRLEAQSGCFLGDAAFTHTGGPGTHQWRNGPSYNEGKTVVTAILSASTRPVSFELSANEYKKAVVFRPASPKKLVVAGNKLVINVPHSSKNGRVTMSVGARSMTFSPGKDISNKVPGAKSSSRKNGNYMEYTYTLPQ